MGINFGQFRNRRESLKSLPGVTSEALGETDIIFEKFDYTETAIVINEQLDKVQARYNQRYHYPPAKP